MRRFATSLFAALAFVPVALLPAVFAPSVRADEITLGASVQMTGSSANTGRYYRDGYQFAVDHINAKGGITVGGKKYTLALKILDNQSDKDLSARQYVQLVTQDKVNFLLGPFASDFALADSAVAEKYEVPMIQGGGASDQIFSRGFKYVFGTLPAASKYFLSTVNMMKELKPKPQNVALLFADDSFDVSVAQGTRRLLKEGGFALAIDEKYSTNATDFGTLLARIKSANIDAVLVAGHETEVLNFIRQSKSLDVSPKLYSFTVGVPSEDFRRSLGADGDYALGMTVWLPSHAAKDSDFGDAAKFAAAYKAKYNYDPDYHAASAVVDVQAFVKALQAAGTLDPKAVREAIAKLDFGSQYGRIKFDASGQIDLPQTVIQVDKGKVVAVYSTKFLSKPRYPMPDWKHR